jgi:hypothetical protein
MRLHFAVLEVSVLLINKRQLTEKIAVRENVTLELFSIISSLDSVELESRMRQ